MDQYDSQMQARFAPEIIKAKLLREFFVEWGLDDKTARQAALEQSFSCVAQLFQDVPCEPQE